MVKNPAANAGDVGLIPRAVGQLSPRAAVTAPQEKHRNEKPTHHSEEEPPLATAKIQCSQNKK